MLGGMSGSSVSDMESGRALRSSTFQPGLFTLKPGLFTLIHADNNKRDFVNKRDFTPLTLSVLFVGCVGWSQ